MKSLFFLFFSTFIEATPASIFNQIVNGNSAEPDSSRFVEGKTLGYVTPWNSKGYKIAEEQPEKFDFICPVWLQILPEGPGFQLNGLHDIDLAWIRKIKAKSPDTKIIPRINIERLAGDHLQALINPNHPQHDVMVSLFLEPIVKLVQEKDYESAFDGFVLECQSIPQYLIQLISALGIRLRNLDKLLIIPITPPSRSPPNIAPFDSLVFDYLKPVVDYFSLMTYDFSAGPLGGPNAPYEWIEEQIDQLCHGKNCNQILMGLPFYGYRYDGKGEGSAILGYEMVNLLKEASEENTSIAWDKLAKEHVFKISKDGKETTVYYPTRDFLKARFELANEMGVGIAIWEIGQGLDCFFAAPPS